MGSSATPATISIAGGSTTYPLLYFSALKQGWAGIAKLPADDVTPPAKTTNRAVGRPSTITRL